MASEDIKAMEGGGIIATGLYEQPMAIGAHNCG